MFCVGVRSDDAAAMTGQHSGVITQIKARAPKCMSTHCFLHQKILATKKMSTGLNSVLSEVVKMMNHVKENALNSRLFAALCDYTGADHKQLLLHADVGWLSRGKILSRVFELQNELAEFLQDKKQNWSQFFRDVCWTAKLAYLADIFAIFNDLNTSMQGRMALCLTMADKIDGQKRKLEVWKSRVSRLL
ncbi:SCAN domain-containing protein 3 [Chelydra serpentina]|uniref:SCAN domain-containing protein 3 n=1 Tax=Chelydra serpentina TaxID=8475 RepID=A0A8T1T792_CHESE|nr:SCAN domain-containing protein 3 [Chelydra serpentina]